MFEHQLYLQQGRAKAVHYEASRELCKECQGSCELIAVPLRVFWWAGLCGSGLQSVTKGTVKTDKKNRELPQLHNIYTHAAKIKPVMSFRMPAAPLVLCFHSVCPKKVSRESNHTPPDRVTVRSLQADAAICTTLLF